MFEIELKLNGEIIVPSELAFAQNINDFSALQFKLERNKLPQIKDNISNIVELTVNSEILFTGFILNCEFNNIMTTLACVPLAYIVNITNIKSVNFPIKYSKNQLLIQLNPVIYSDGFSTTKFGVLPAFDHNS